MRGVLRYFLPAEHTSLLRTCAIAFVVGAFAAVIQSISKMLPTIFVSIGWKDAGTSSVLGWVQLMLLAITAIPVWACTLSGGIAFARRRGLWSGDGLAFSFMLIRDYLKDALGMSTHTDRK